MQTSRDDTFNVMVLGVVITVIVIAGSTVALSALTGGNLYLSSYFILEVLFNTQNTAASEELAAIAFGQTPGAFLPILLVVIIDNLSRILIVSFIIAAVIDFLNFANVESVINDLKANRLRNHVILCGYDDVSERLIKKLKDQRTRYIVIEPNREKGIELNENRILNIMGEFTSEDVLRSARIERATAIVFTSNNDADNVVGTIVARRLNPRIKVLSRLGEEGIRKKIYGIGADMAVIPEHLAGIEIGDYVARAHGA